jgi:hypothetical protein
MIEAYPLYWPEGWKRTKSWQRERSKFKSTFAVARDELINEVGRLRGRYFNGNDPVLSTNISLRQDGLPYANQRDPEDAGVAIYFEYKKHPYCFACDKYKCVWENMVAIRKTIEAIRGIERWGASDMMEKAFQGFVAIEASRDDWWVVLCVDKNADRDLVKRSYMNLRSSHHPDKPGGSAKMFNEITDAWNQYQAS